MTEAERQALIRSALTSRHQMQFVRDPQFRAQVYWLAEIMAGAVDQMATAGVKAEEARAASAWKAEHEGDRW